jgi:hypothetical protein
MNKNALMLLLTGCLLCSDAFAQTTQPSSILQQISVESEKLFQSVRPGLVVVQMPAPRWLTLMMEQNDPLRRWDDKIDPALQKRLMELQRGTANLTPGTAPATQPATDTQVSPPPRFLGLMVNSDGHLVIPMYVEREVFADRPVDVFVGGKTVKAKFVGSDRKTNLTVLKLDDYSGKTVDLGEKPGEGALVMALSATGESGQLVVWTGGMEENTVVLSVDGKVAGFSRGGQFLSGESSKVIIDQLIKYGAVKRATLGVWLQQFASADGATGVKIVKVQEDSAAAKGGLQAGDVIVSLDEQPMTDVPTFAAAIAAGKGATPIKVIRNGTQVECKVQLTPE